MNPDAVVAIAELDEIATLLIPALAGGKMVAAVGEDVKKLALIALLLGGCFTYGGDINQRPSLEITNPLSTPIERGQPGIELVAQSNDPDGDFVELHWRLNICADANDFSTCDPEPAFESSNPTFKFDAPVAHITGEPAKSLRVVLEGIDERGAVAKPTQQLNIPLINGKPTVVLTDQSSYDNTKGTPIDVFAVYGDADDGAAAVTVTFELFPPPGVSSATLAPICLPIGTCDPHDTKKLEQGMRFTPDLDGEWTVRVTATDPLDGPDGQTVTSHAIFVNVDKFPCLGILTPIAPDDPTTLPVNEPTLFQVHQVLDALDPFPTDLDDPILLPAQFRWSIDRQVQDSSTGNSLAFDPAVYAPGQIVEVRVEITDRINPFPTCDPNFQICEHDVVVPQCLQRQTWLVEVL